MERKAYIEKAEAQLVEEKAWYEKGEVDIRSRPKNTLVRVLDPQKRENTEQHTGSDEESSGAADKLEVTRKKAAAKVTEKLAREIERFVRQKVKAKEYDNIRRPRNPGSKKSQDPEAKPEKAEDPPKAQPLHDQCAERKTENDKYMDRAQLLKLLGEIDRDLAELTDPTYIASGAYAEAI